MITRIGQASINITAFQGSSASRATRKATELVGKEIPLTKSLQSNEILSFVTGRNFCTRTRSEKDRFQFAKEITEWMLGRKVLDSEIRNWYKTESLDDISSNAILVCKESLKEQFPWLNSIDFNLLPNTGELESVRKALRIQIRTALKEYGFEIKKDYPIKPLSIEIQQKFPPRESGIYIADF